MRRLPSVFPCRTRVEEACTANPPCQYPRRMARCRQRLAGLLPDPQAARRCLFLRHPVRPRTCGFDRPRWPARSAGLHRQRRPPPAKTTPTVPQDKLERFKIFCSFSEVFLPHGRAEARPARSPRGGTRFCASAKENNGWRSHYFSNRSTGQSLLVLACGQGVQFPVFLGGESRTTGKRGNPTHKPAATCSVSLVKRSSSSLTGRPQVNRLRMP